MAACSTSVANYSPFLARIVRSGKLPDSRTTISSAGWRGRVLIYASQAPAVAAWGHRTGHRCPKKAEI
jgi:hypothetical protein